MRRTVIRQLRSGEPRPAGEPKRYENSEGYVRLRWRLGKGEYVEMYERDEAGALVRRKPSRDKRIDAQRAMELYEAGHTQPEVGEILGADSGTISRLLRRHGVRIRDEEERFPIDEAEVVRLYTAERLGSGTIADRLGTTGRRIIRILRRRGVTIRPRHAPKKVDRPAGPTYQTEFKRVRPFIRERSGGWCEARVPGVCRGRARHVHHIRTRARGGDNSPSNLLDLCFQCHRWIHTHPAAATERGWLRHSWEEAA